MGGAQSYELVYFDIPGLAEAIRLTFRVGKVQFKDTRLTREQWAEMKNSESPPSALRTLPMLRINDGEIVHCESSAILRYVGKRTGLYPGNDMEAFKVDEASGALNALWAKIGPSITESDNAVKMRMRKELADTVIPTAFAALERLIEHNKADKFAVFAGDRACTFDFELYCFVRYLKRGILDGIPGTVVDKFPVIQRVVSNVEKIAAVAEWHASH
uniref:Glutathione transferase n=1 Tax=Erythrolobus australicus TaxID=1077150 RepID=A0A7S1TM19_9RHOD|mmetsp:Transcript_1850/g.4896  ORF Transcript_1850/g.4896 Transcript_1850/m.4896 type:complete len:216 (+) Transcript_1850:43-690(+)